MTPKERILAAIRHQIPDRIPLAIQEIENEHRFAPFVGILDASEPVHPNIGYYARSYEKLGIDGFRIEIGYDAPPAIGPTGEPLNEWGTIAKKDYGTEHWYPLANADSVQQIEAHAWPDSDKYDYALAAYKVRDKGDRFALRGPHWWPLLCRVFDLMGMEQTMSMMSLEPTIFEAILDKIFQITYTCTEKLLQACGPNMPIMCAADDFASQQGMMISPAQWRRYLKPRYQKLFELGKHHGCYVWFHSCGNILEVLPDLIDIGLDIWETVQLHTLPISPTELKKQYGEHITFFGGVNTQRLPFMTPQQVQSEVNACINSLGAGGGYICSADHGIRADVPYENIVALFNTARQFRKSGYTSEE